MFFEEFHTGQNITTPVRTIGEHVLDAFLELAGLDLPMFLDDESARQMGHARRLVTGPMILAVAMGLGRTIGLFDHVIAGLEFNRMHFRKAVHPGDALLVEVTVLKTRPTSDPSRGLVVLAFRVLNQDGALVLETEGTYLFRREAASAAALSEE